MSSERGHPIGEPGSLPPSGLDQLQLPQTTNGSILVRLLELSRMLVSSQNLQVVLNRALQIAVELVEAADRGSLQLLGEGGRTLRTVALFPADKPLDDVVPFLPGVGVAGTALARNQTVNIADIQSSPLFVPGAYSPRFRSILAAPLAVQGRKLGTLSLTSPHAGTFTTADENLLQLIADQAAVVIHNASLFSELRASEAAVRESEARFRSVAEKAPDIIYIIDLLHSKALFMNRPEFLGYSVAEMEASGSIFYAIHPDDRARVGQHWQLALQGDVDFCEYRVQHKQGHWEWVQSRERILSRDANGQPRELLVVLTPVTEQKAVQAALQQSEAKYRTLTEQLPLGVYRLDDEGQIIHANRTLATMLGVDRPELLLGTRLQALCADPQDMVAIQQAWATGHMNLPRSLPLQTLDGRQIWVHLTGRVIADAPGNTRYITGTIEDITTRRAAEERIRLLAAAVDSIGEGIFITNAEHDEPGPTVQFVNEAFCHMSGYSREELLGQSPVPQLVAIADWPAPGRGAPEPEGEGITVREVTRYRKDGTSYLVLWQLAPIRDAGGQITHYVSMERDITDLRRMEEQLHQWQKMEAIGRLAGGVAHDFNNVLTVIGSYTALLLHQLPLDDPLRHYVDQINKADKQASLLTNQLLQLSRQQVSQPRVFDLNQIVRDMQMMLQQFTGPDMTLQFVPEAPVALVRTEPGQMEQVILNLVINAHDAMPDGGQITIRTQVVEVADAYPQMPAGPHILLSVGDTGIGIEESVRPHIFEPFFTTKEAGKGTGLGLSTVYAIVTRSHGRIELETQPGQGTTFLLYLPQAQDPVAEEVQEQAGPDERHGSGRILLVEDDEMVRDLVLSVLRDNGYQVLTAPDGQAALRLFQQLGEPLQLLLTDVIMPGTLSGVQLAEALRARQPELAVLFISGYTDQIALHHDSVMFQRAKFVAKPFRPEKLLQAVRQLLAREA